MCVPTNGFVPLPYLHDFWSSLPASLTTLELDTGQLYFKSSKIDPSFVAMCDLLPNLLHLTLIFKLITGTETHHLIGCLPSSLQTLKISLTGEPRSTLFKKLPPNLTVLGLYSHTPAPITPEQLALIPESVTELELPLFALRSRPSASDEPLRLPRCKNCSCMTLSSNSCLFCRRR